jgi:hypothetical protein
VPHEAEGTSEGDAEGSTAETGVLEALVRSLAISIIWTPREDHPVAIHYLRLGSHRLLTNVVDPDAPCSAWIPQALHGKTVKLRWLIGPLVDLTKLEIWLVGVADKPPKRIDAASSSERKRAAAWRDAKDVTLVL